VGVDVDIDVDLLTSEITTTRARVSDGRTALELGGTGARRGCGSGDAA
jgi:hypothetical protein